MIQVQTLINAPLEKVWHSFTNPEHIVNWNNASADWHCPKAENDLRVGGAFNYRMAAKDGKVAFNFEGEYVEVVLFKKIIYFITDGRRVEVVFEETDGNTMIMETFEPETINSEDLQRSGWNAILENFKDYTER